MFRFFNTLPQDCVNQILYQVPLRELQRFFVTCKRFRALKENISFYHDYLRVNFGIKQRGNKQLNLKSLEAIVEIIKNEGEKTIIGGIKGKDMLEERLWRKEKQSLPFYCRFYHTLNIKTYGVTLLRSYNLKHLTMIRPNKDIDFSIFPNLESLTIFHRDDVYFGGRGEKRTLNVSNNFKLKSLYAHGYLDFEGEFPNSLEYLDLDNNIVYDISNLTNLNTLVCNRVIHDGIDELYSLRNLSLDQIWECDLALFSDLNIENIDCRRDLLLESYKLPSLKEAVDLDDRIRYFRFALKKDRTKEEEKRKIRDFFGFSVENDLKDGKQITKQLNVPLIFHEKASICIDKFYKIIRRNGGRRFLLNDNLAYHCDCSTKRRSIIYRVKDKRNIYNELVDLFKRKIYIDVRYVDSGRSYAYSGGYICDMGSNSKWRNFIGIELEWDS